MNHTLEIDGNNKSKKRPHLPHISSGECTFPTCPVELASAVMPDAIRGRKTSSIKECHLSFKESCTTLFDWLEKFNLHGRFLKEHTTITAIRGEETGNKKFAQGHTSFSNPKEGDINLGKEIKYNIYCSNCYCTDHESFTLRVIGVLSVCYEIVEGGEKNEKVGVTSETQDGEMFEDRGEEKNEGGCFYCPVIKLLVVYPHSDQCHIKLSKRRSSKLDKEYYGRGWDTYPFPTDIWGNTYHNFVDKLKLTNWNIGDHHGELQMYEIYVCNYLLNNNIQTL